MVVEVIMTITTEASPCRIDDNTEKQRRITTPLYPRVLPYTAEVFVSHRTNYDQQSQDSKTSGYPLGGCGSFP